MKYLISLFFVLWGILSLSITSASKIVQASWPIIVYDSLYTGNNNADKIKVLKTLDHVLRKQPKYTLDSYRLLNPEVLELGQSVQKIFVLPDEEDVIALILSGTYQEGGFGKELWIQDYPHGDVFHWLSVSGNNQVGIQTLLNRNGVLMMLTVDRNGAGSWEGIVLATQLTRIKKPKIRHCFYYGNWHEFEYLVEKEKITDRYSFGMTQFYRLKRLSRKDPQCKNLTLMVH